MAEGREPPYPGDTRARGWRFEVDMEKVKASDTWLRAKTGEIRGALMLLWGEAWQQTPCGSLPADDELVALIIDMPQAKFAKHRAVLMRGWWLAVDGRLYHDTIVERVLGMIEKREKDSSRKSLYDKKFKTIRDRDGCACVYCGARTYLSLDHLIAVSRGGTGDESNLVTACRRCNSVKGARTPDEAGMTFVNEQARALWYAIRSEFVAFGSTFVTREERGNDDTKHQNQNQEPELNTPPKPPRKRRGAAAQLVSIDLIVAEGVDRQHAEDWLAVRAKKTLPLTPTAWEDVKAEAAKAGMSLADAVKTSASNSWGGFKAKWLTEAGRNGSAAPALRVYDSAEETQRMLDAQSAGTRNGVPEQLRGVVAQLTGRKAA